MNYGVLNTARYYYRKHSDSLMDNVYSSPEYFTVKLKECFLKLIEYSLDVSGTVAKFIQYVIIQDLHGIIRSANFNEFVGDKGILQVFKMYFVLYR